MRAKTQAQGRSSEASLNARLDFSTNGRFWRLPHRTQAADLLAVEA
jgi:hypothetical protein